MRQWTISVFEKVILLVSVDFNIFLSLLKNEEKVNEFMTVFDFESLCCILRNAVSYRMAWRDSSRVSVCKAKEK